MSSLKKINTQISPTIEVQNIHDIMKVSGNVYRSVFIIGRRADQITGQIRGELHSKLEEFASHQDNLEEIHENREQIEISRYYEKLPKSTLLALDEFLGNKMFFHEREETPAETKES